VILDCDFALMSRTTALAKLAPGQGKESWQNYQSRKIGLDY
jgi:hypothetical protein